MNKPRPELDKIKASYARAVTERRVIICAGTGCVANGALKVHRAFLEEMDKQGVSVTVELREEGGDRKATHPSIHLSKSGCQGFCQAGPLVTIEPEGILYTRVTAQDVAEIVSETLIGHKAIERLLYKIPATGQVCKGTAEIPFYKLQQRTVLSQCGRLDPENIREYIANDGYEAARKAFTSMKPEDVCAEMLASGLRGRGGGGFPTGKKWDLARLQKSDNGKYVICNGDEGDPGAFMDRSVMEGNPHSVLEGMMIAARATGADHGVVYVRAEYPLAVQRVRKAVVDAEAMGVLGDDIFGSGQSFRIEVMEGAGAFVCGEETAMIASIEGQRGMPRPKPPFPAQSGLMAKPTVINNVETLASVPMIIREGAAKYRSCGTEKSPGTKTFAITGDVANTGLIEVPFGSTLEHVVFNIGGGVTKKDGSVDNSAFKAVQIGGPSGGCLTREHLKMPMDFDSLTGIGAMVGSGGLVVINQDTCMVKLARFFMQFTQNESCGKCVPCREGTRQLLALLDDISEGRATAETLDLIEKLGNVVRKASLCGLGKSAPNPVLSTFKAFREEYEAHVFHKHCPTGQCKALKKLAIDAEKCKGCTLCKKKCPVGAISGDVKKPHVIDGSLCIKCGVCESVCKFKAIA